MTVANMQAPSLFNSPASQTLGKSTPRANSSRQANSLVDLLYDGFYMVFLLRNGYTPASATTFRESINEYLHDLKRASAPLKPSPDDIYMVKFAFCALVDETVFAHAPSIRQEWETRPLQIEHFGEHLAGERFFEYLEKIRQEGLPRLQVLEVFHMALLLGFQGKYVLDGAEKLSYMTSRLGDDITHLKGSRASFAPHWSAPDKILHTLRNEIPLWVIGSVFGLMSVLGFMGLRWYLVHQTQNDLGHYSQLIQLAPQAAHITITLP